MKIKVIEVVGHEYYDDNYSFFYDKQYISDWEDVSEEELNALNIWAADYNKAVYPRKVIVISEKMMDYHKTIKDYLIEANKLKKKMEKKELERQEKEARRIATKEKNKEARKIKEQEKKRKLLEELKKELGENNE